MKTIPVGLILVAMALPFGRASAVTINMIDDFEDGTTMGWEKGIKSTLQPTVEQEAGGNHYLEVRTNAKDDGADSKLTFGNPDQWRGNYNTAGVGSIQSRMINLGDETLYMRLRLEAYIGDYWHFYSSEEALELPADGQWYDLSFGLDEDHVRLFGTDNYDAQWRVKDIKGAIRKLGFVNSKEGLNGTTDFWGGDPVFTTLGLDDIRTTSEVLQAISLSTVDGDVPAVPVPGAIWLFATGLLGITRLSAIKSRSQKI